jgi:catechol 2,3-dioxygenase-like lactoylglutathione lyase family enzyme
MLTRVDHLVIAVDDLDRATDTYRGLLGLEPSWRGVHPDAGTANTLFRLANTYVELLAPEGDEPFADFLRDHIEQGGEGPLAIAYATKDAAVAVATLRERGIAAPDASSGSGRESTTGAVREWKTSVLPPPATRGIPTIVIEHVTPEDVLQPARPIGAIDAAVNAVDHVVIMSGSADAAIALYQNALGLRLAFDKTFPERGLRLIFFRLGGLTVECAVPLGEGALPADGDDKIWGISYRVGDIRAAQARLTAAGFDVSEVRKGHKPGTAVCTVRKETHGVATLVISHEADE